MKLNKRKIKLFYISTIFLLLNYPLQIISLIEFPITMINPINIHKYKGIEFDTEIPENIKNILNKTNYDSSSNELKIFAEAGDLKVISTILFSIKVELGSSQQTFNLVLDTGSSITWVPIKYSTDLYPIEHHYDPYISSTSKKIQELFEIQYGSGSCKGRYFSDKLKYIKNKEFDLIFGGAEKTDFGVNDVDGIIGLSRIYEDKSKSFVHMLCKSGATESEIFSFKLGLNKTSGYIGKFYIGKHDDFNKDNVASCEMKNSNYFEKNLWACEMTSFSIYSKAKNIKLTSEKKISVIFDSGTNVIFLPLIYLQKILSNLGNINCYPKKYSVKGQQIRYQLICLNEAPDFHLVIGGHTFILPSEYFFYFTKNIGFSKIMFQDSFDFNNEVFIIGSPFFMLFHILFDSYSKELHFYPEKSEFLIKGNWWNNNNHIILVVILAVLIILLIILIVLYIIWNKRNKLDEDMKESFEIKSYFGLL